MPDRSGEPVILSVDLSETREICPTWAANQHSRSASAGLEPQAVPVALAIALPSRANLKKKISYDL